MIEAAPFPVRPDSVRPGRSARARTTASCWTPIRIARSPGATVAASWAFERGIGLRAPAGAHEFVTETGADGRYTVPKLDELPERRIDARPPLHADRLPPRPRRLAQRSPVSRAGRPAATSASAAAACAWRSGSQAMRHAEHVAFVGGGARVRTVAAWELQAAALELEGAAPAPALPAPEAARRRCRRSARRRCRSTSRSCWPTTRSAA